MFLSSHSHRDVGGAFGGLGPKGAPLDLLGCPLHGPPHHDLLLSPSEVLHTGMQAYRQAGRQAGRQTGEQLAHQGAGEFLYVRARSSYAYVRMIIYNLRLLLFRYDSYIARLTSPHDGKSLIHTCICRLQYTVSEMGLLCKLGQVRLG